MTKPEDERTAKARERAIKFLHEYPYPKCLSYPQCDGELPGEPHADNCPMKLNKQPKPADIMAAFAESERASAIKEAREECARAVCHHCRDYFHSEKYITKAKHLNGKWVHEEVGFERERGGFDCYAEKIREHFRALGEQ